MSLSHPPRFRVMNVAMALDGSKEIPADLKPGMRLKGEVAVINTGREKSFIDQPVCMPYWRVGPLPMYRPYFVSGSRIFSAKTIPLTAV